MKISIVTPWLEHHELLEDYAAAVVPELREGDEVIIVDNGDAPEMPFTSPAHLAFTTIARYDKGETRNLGFVGGSNFGLMSANADAVLFLNNDIRLGRPGWLCTIREALEPGTLVGPLNNGHHAAVYGKTMPYIDGWCLAGMRTDLLGLGGFDGELAEPAYYSDNLLCLEARARGMTLRDVRVGLVHKLNATAGPAGTPAVRAAAEPNRLRYIARARELLVAA